MGSYAPPPWRFPPPHKRHDHDPTPADCPPASKRARLTTPTPTLPPLSQQPPSPSTCPSNRPSLLLSLPMDALLNITSFLRLRDISFLSSTTHDILQAGLLHHIQMLRGKYRFPEAVVSHLQHCSRLHTLDLKGNKVSYDGLRSLSNFLERSSHLERLDLSGLTIGAPGIRLLAQSLEKRGCPRLQSLHLAVNNIGDEGARILASALESGACSNLETLNLSNSVIGSTGLESLAKGLAACQKLRVLNLSNNPLGSGGMDKFASAITTCLQHLSIFNSLLDSLSIERLTAKATFPSLTHLNLSWNRVTSQGARALARSLARGSCPCLAGLNLSHSLIHGDALLDLAIALRYGPRNTLKNLSLGWNPLCSDRSPTFMANLEVLARALAGCISLETLNFSNVDLGVEGAIAFANGLGSKEDHALACPSLTMLNVSWNRIAAAGAASFGRLLTQGSCPRMCTLDLSYNHVGSEGLRNLVTLWEDAPIPPQLEVHVMGNGVTSCNYNNIPARNLAQVLGTRPCLDTSIITLTTDIAR